MMWSEKSGSGTGTLDHVEFGWLEWDPEGSPVSIHMSPGVAEGIAHDSVGNVDAETGGLLLGRVEMGPHPAVWIERYQRLPRAHELSREFILDSEEITALEAAAGNVVGAGEFAVVGLFRSHRRPGFQLEEPDFDLMRRYFRDSSDLILLVRPVNEREVSARFHVWDEQSGARAVGEEIPLRKAGSEKPKRAELTPAPSVAVPDVPDTAIEAPREKPRRLVPDFAPNPKPMGADGHAQPGRLVEPAPSVFGLSTPPALHQWTSTDEITAENEGHERLKRWLPLVAALVVVGGALWFFLRPGAHLISNPSAGQTTEVVRPLGLFVDAAGGAVWQVSWNPNATALHGERNVRLFVRERNQQSTDDASDDGANPIDLSARDLASGSYQYRPVGNDVTFRLEVTDQAGRVSAESFRLVRTPAPAPPAPAAPKPEEAPAESTRVIQPRATYRAPAVVAAGVRSRIKGVVPIDIRVQIDTRGHVTSATPVTRQHSGIEEYLSARAEQAAKLWRFDPARENGKAVEGSQILHFVFQK